MCLNGNVHTIHRLAHTMVLTYLVHHTHIQSTLLTSHNMAGPVEFGVGSAGNILRPSGRTLASRGAPCALCSPILWWDCNSIPRPNHTNTCYMSVFCSTGVAHSPCQCTLLQNCQQWVRKQWDGSCASIVLVLFCFGSSHEVSVGLQVGLGQLCFLRKPVHAFLYLTINVSVRSCNLIKFVMFNYVSRYIWEF